MSSDDIVLRVSNVSKCFEMYEKPVHRLFQTLCAGRRQFYKEFWALREINLEVRRGECVGIIGRNGAGKSTLLQIITGTLQPTTGSVEISGRIAALLELGSGFNPDFTGRENVYMNAAILGLTRKETEEKFQEIVDFADIGEFIDQPVKTYSSGMMVRLAFSVNAFVDPDILIVDEALAVGDIRFQLKCYQKMREFLDNREKCIIFVTHDMSVIKKFCSRVVWLNQGRLHRIGPALEIVEAYLAFMFQGMKQEDGTESTASKISATTTAGGAGNSGSLRPIPPDAMSNGEGGARILEVGFCDAAGVPIRILDRPQRVRLQFRYVADMDIPFPLYAFQILDRRSTAIMGCNTKVLNKNVSPVGCGESCLVSFEFDFPEINNDEYVILLAVNNCADSCGVRLHNVVDAYNFQYCSDSPFQQQGVLLKLPDCTIEYASAKQ